MSHWFRLYSDLLNDPKCQSLGGAAFKTWVNLLCIATENGGEIDEKSLPFKLRMKSREVRAHIATLKSAGLLDVVENTLRPHNWESRQWLSDDSKERVRRHREKQKKKRDGNGHVTVTVTAPDTDTDTESTLPNGKAGSPGPAPNGATRIVTRIKPETAAYNRCKKILGDKFGGKVAKELIAHSSDDIDNVFQALKRIEEASNPRAYATAILDNYEHPAATDDWIT